MTTLSLADVLDWWSGELPEAESERVEEALFADDSVLEQAQCVAALARAIAHAAEAGGIRVACLTRTLSDRLENSGLPHVRYEARPGETVQCFATRDQRFSVLHLKGDFSAVERVDVRMRSPHTDEILVEDVPVDWESGEVAFLQSGSVVRSLPSASFSFELRGKRSGATEVIGTYFLEHHALPG